jgi:hypothetical protein
MKKPKRGVEISAHQSGGTAVGQINCDREFLSAKKTLRVISLARSRPELEVQRYPAAQLNRHQHGVWV